MLTRQSRRGLDAAIARAEADGQVDWASRHKTKHGSPPGDGCSQFRLSARLAWGSVCTLPHPHVWSYGSPLHAPIDQQQPTGVFPAAPVPSQASLPGYAAARVAGGAGRFFPRRLGLSRLAGRSARAHPEGREREGGGHGREGELRETSERRSRSVGAARTIVTPIRHQSFG